MQPDASGGCKKADVKKRAGCGASCPSLQAAVPEKQKKVADVSAACAGRTLRRV
jgi:hypothetical protein